MLTFATALLATVTTLGQSDGEKTFKSYTDFAVGGVWTTTIDNKQIEHSYRKLADGKFVQLTGKGGPFPMTGMIGIDPEAQKCAWWLFHDDGSVVKLTMTQESKAAWLFEGGGKGPKGSIRLKFRITRTTEDTITEEGIEVEVDGEQVAPVVTTWTRQKTAASP